MANKSKKTWCFYCVFIVFLWVWQLPQHILALILYVLFKISGKILILARHEGKWLITVDVPGWGVSLGQYVLMDKAYNQCDWRHEYGHSIQSLYWGSLYLLTIGIPSALFNNLWDRIAHINWTVQQRHKWYYNRWPEKQADRLGGVTRVWEN